MTVFNDALEEGAENLVDALDTIGATTLRLFGYRRGPDGWTRDPDPQSNVPEGQVGHSREYAKRKQGALNDRMQWVPKLDSVPMPTPQKATPWVDNPTKGSRLTDSGRDNNGRFFMYEDDSRVMKVDEQGRVIWSRWKA